MKKILTLILVLAAVLSVSGVALAADGNLDIADGSIVIEADGYTQGTNAKEYYSGDYVIYGTTTENTITVNGIADGKTITLNGVNMSGSTSMINVNADATILLANTNSVISIAGRIPTICIASGKTLVIDGTGSLTVKGGNQSAGIGGKGNLVIDGGNISAVGKGGAAAIGGCYGGPYNIFGSITINDGTVTISKDEGAEYSGICPVANTAGGGNVTINGGKINISLKYAQDYAAIGGGKGSNAFTGDVIINGGEITVDVTANANQYAIRTAGAFKMTGGTLVEIKKHSSSTRDYITANSVSITGGNVKEYYKEPTDSNGRNLAKLYVVDSNGEAQKNKEVEVSVNGGTPWKAVTDDNGVITTYMADTDKVNGTDKLNGGWLIGGTCTCAPTSFDWSDTITSAEVYSTVLTVPVKVSVDKCSMPIHKVDEVDWSVSSGNAEKTPDGKLKLNPSAADYTVELKATLGSAVLTGDTHTITVTADNTVNSINIANGPVTVKAAAEAGKVVYKQNETEVCEVGEATPVVIFGTYTFEEGNAIIITNCSPTIVLKDLTITAPYNRNGPYAESNILIDGTANDHVKFILSGTNTLVRGSGDSENLHLNSCGLEIREAELTIDCSCEGESCADKSCNDKLIVDVQGYNRGAAIGSRYVKDWGTDNVNEPEGFTLNIEGGQIQANSNYFGAAIGTGRVSKNVLTNKVAINISDGYVKAIANDDGVAIGAGRSDNPPTEGILSVNITGGVVDAISKSLGGGTNATSDAVLASDVTVSGGAEVTVSGSINAKKSVEVKGTDTTLELKQKEGWDESYGNNPGGSIGNGAEWDVKDEDGNVIETVVRPGNVQVKVSDGATLTTAGGINGSLSTSGNATTANINGVAPQSGKAGTDKNVGGVSGNVTVGAGSTVSVAEDVRGDATIEKGGTLSVGAVQGELDAAPGSFVNGTTVLHEIIEGANGTFNGQAEGLPFTSNAEYDDFLSVEVDGNVVDGANYTVSEGSTVVTLKAAYLKTLTVGEHTLEIVSKTGTAATKFTIAQGAGVPVYTGGSSYSGPSIWYIGGNSFGTSTTQMPTSVEIDNVPVPFSMEGSNIVVSCIDPGARWATVKWNSTSATINFNPDANVVCAQVVIPKTGDMPIWAAIAEFLGF